MARHLIRLKVTLLRAAARTGGVRGKAGFVLAFLLAAAIGLLGGLAFVGLRWASNARAGDIVPAAFAGVFVIWVLGPIISVGSEGSLEVDRLALLPLTRRQLMPGLLGAAAVGAGGLTTVLVLLGAVVGMSPAAPGLVLTVAAAALELATCVAASRLVSTAISGAARTRRWRDIAIFVGPLLGLGINLVWQVYFRTSLRQDASGRVHSHPTAIGSALRTVVRLLPSGPAAEVMVMARSGRWLLAVTLLGVAAVVLAALLALWWVAIQRVLTNSPESAGPRRGRAAPTSAAELRPALFPRLLPMLPTTRTGAVAAKELRLMWREPRQRAALISSLFPGLIPLISLGAFTSHSRTVVLLAAVPVYTVAATATNQFGFDGARHWTNVAAGADMAADIAGKNAARAVVAVCVGAVAALALAWRTGGWEMLWPTVTLAAGAFGIAIGLANLVSVIAPFPMPDSSGNLYSAGSTGQGLAAIGPGLAVLFGGGVAVAPLVIATLLTAGHALSGTLVGFADLAVGLGAWWSLWQAAARRSNPRQPELLIALSPKHAA